MEKVIRLRRRNRLSVYIILAIVLIVAIAAGVYFFIDNRDKEPSRGTYVIENREKVFCNK